MSTEERLAKLERSTRIWRASALTVALLLVAVVAMGQAAVLQPGTISAREFIVKDEDGRTRGVLGNGMVWVSRLDKAGEERGRLMLTSHGLFITDRQSKAGLRFSLTAAEMAFRDFEGSPRLSMGTARDGAATIRIKGADGKETWTAP